MTSSEIVLQAVLDFWTFDFRTTCTFIHYKFTPLIHLLYAKFRLSYTADKKAFQAITQWRHTTESQTVFCAYKCQKGRLQWSHVLRNGSAATCLLKLRFEIPPRTWMSTSCECSVLSDRGLCNRPITRPEESYQVWCV